jgi:23S rRNA (cytosine1962-C5)-methyltransferase
MGAYELIDAGGGARLERFGAYVVDRPHPSAVGERRLASAWRAAELRFDRDRGWSGPAEVVAADGWPVEVAGLTMLLRPTAAGQVGLFPEHTAMLPWLRSAVSRERADDGPPSVLHLFAYTGLVTLALARAGAAVVHVDAARPSVAWARENAARNDLADAPIRWLVDDVRAFVAREVRRGRRYDGVVLDPPSYGHGGAGNVWQLERDLGPLLADLRRVLVLDAFLLLTTHTPGWDADRLANEIRAVPGPREAGELTLTASSGARLRLGAYARAGGAS